ncbi:MAG: WG repeat-containing protein [Clostridia bacterium]|nr:WG repeat-containing protein [Clostridia bacterium]
MANKFCTKCGHKLSKNDIYCRSCNAVVDVKAMTHDSGIKPKRKRSKAPLIVLAIVLPILLISAGIFSLFYFEILDLNVIMSYFPQSNEEPDTGHNGEYPDEYQYIIDKTVEAYPWKDNGNASPIPEIESASPLYSQGEHIQSIGFNMEDLNGDGTKELFVGLMTSTHEWVVIDIYTLHNGRAVHIAKADHYTDLVIKKDSSIILDWEDNSALSHGCSNYILPYDTDELSFKSGVVYDPNLAVEHGIITDISYATEDNSWFNKTSVNGNDTYTPISGEDAQSYKDTLYQNLYDMEFTPAKLPEGMTTAVDTAPAETEPAPEEIKDYEIILETSYSSQNIDCVPALGYYDHTFSPLFISVIETPEKNGYHYIDYNREIWNLHTYPTEPFVDGMNDTINDMATGYVEKTSMEFVPFEQAAGHGSMVERYAYIPSTGEIVINMFGTISEPSKIPENAVVSILEECTGYTDPNYVGEYNGVHYRDTQKYGIAINSILVVNCVYDSYENYQNGTCALQKDGMWTFFNKNGEEIISGYYDSFYNSSYGYIALYRDGMWAYCDYEGNLVTDFVFEEARPVYRGMAWVKLDGYWKVIRLTDYEESFTEADASAALVKYLTRPDRTPTVTPLSDWEACTFYKSEGYCFIDENGWKYIVLYNGDVYRLES